MLYQGGDQFPSQELLFIVRCLHMMTHELFAHVESMELGLD